MKRGLLLVLLACGEATPPAEEPKTNVGKFVTAPYVELPLSLWAETTSSPQPPLMLGDARESKLLSACGEGDHVLARAAKEAPADATPLEVEPMVRGLGSPAVRLRLISVKGNASDDALEKRLAAMRTPRTRCGLHTKGDVTTIVSTEYLADLDPLPVRSRTGAWLTFDGKLNVPAANPKLVVLGPRGIPKTYPTTVDAGGKGRVHSRFALDRPGAFTVQLVAEVEGGPRPLLEARVFADVPPMHGAEPAPGEKESTLEHMVAIVRTEESLPMLTRDSRLDELAAEHAERMKKEGRIAHDLGEGDLAQRFQARGYAAAVVGENVAKAETLALAHRALWSSPSHRMNLLHAQYTRVGFASATDGSRIWVCEVFSSELR